MHQFPDEVARSAEVQGNLTELFNLAVSSFNYWFSRVWKDLAFGPVASFGRDGRFIVFRRGL
jgi:hypothetical protein